MTWLSWRLVFIRSSWFASCDTEWIEKEGTAIISYSRKNLTVLLHDFCIQISSEKSLGRKELLQLFSARVREKEENCECIWGRADLIIVLAKGSENFAPTLFPVCWFSSRFFLPPFFFPSLALIPKFFFVGAKGRLKDIQSTVWNTFSRWACSHFLAWCLQRFPSELGEEN